MTEAATAQVNAHYSRESTERWGTKGSFAGQNGGGPIDNFFQRWTNGKALPPP